MDDRYKQIIANVQTLVNKQAPLEFVTSYLKHEGLTPKQFKSLVEGPTVVEQIKGGLKAIPYGAIGALESGAIGASALLPEEAEKATREYIKEKAAAARAPFAAQPGAENLVSRELMEGVGSVIPYAVAGFPGLLGRAAVVGLSGAQGAGTARTRAEEAGATSAERSQATGLGTVVGLTQLIPVFSFFNRLGKDVQSGILAGIQRAFTTGGMESAQEAAAQYAQNLIAKGIYKPEQEAIEGTGEAGAYGFGVGALIQGLTDLAIGRRGAGAPSTTPPAAGTAPEAPPTEPAAPGLPEDYARAVQEVEQLKRVPATPEVRERLAQLEAYKNRLVMDDVERLQRKPFAEPASLEEQIKNQSVTQGEFRETLDLPTREIAPEAPTPVEVQEVLDKRVPVEEELRARESGAAPQSVEVNGTTLTTDEELQAAYEAFTTRATANLETATKETPTVLVPEVLDSTGLTKQSGIYKQLVGKDLQNLEDLDAVMQIVERARENKSLPKSTKQALETIATNAFNIYGRQAEMFGPRGGVLPTAEQRIAKPTPVQKKIASIVEGKDLTDPVQIEQVRESLTDYANAPTRSQSAITQIDEFLQTLPPSIPEATDVIQPTEPVASAVEPSPAMAGERGEVPAGRIEESVPTGLDAAPAVAGEPDVGAGVQPTALAAKEVVEKVIPKTIPEVTEGKIGLREAISRLMATARLSRTEAIKVANQLESFGEVDPADIAAFADRANRMQGTTEEDRKSAQGVADKFGGPVVWQEGELSLIRGSSMLSGQPVYIAARKSAHTNVDIESFTGAGFSPEERAKFVAAKKKLEQEDAAQHKTNPFPAFTSGHISISENTPKEYGDIIRGWSKILGIKANIYLTTVADARNNASKFTGIYRAVVSSALNPNNFGETRRLPNGDHYISFADSTSKTAVLEAIAHELGHIHQKEVYEGASPELKASVRKEFEKWLVSQKGGSARELVNSLRAKTTARRTTIAEGKTADSLTRYWRSFDEWYADQVSRWATTNEKPVTVVEKFFARLGRALRAFYGHLRNTKYLANETFVQYLEAVNTSASQGSTIVTSEPAQAMRRGEVELTPEGEKAAALNERMKGISNPAEDGAATVGKGLAGVHHFFTRKDGPSWWTRVRQAVADKDASANEKLEAKFNNTLIDAMGNVRADLMVDQAQDAASLAENVLDGGGIEINKAGLVETYTRKDGVSMKKVFEIISDKLGKKLGSVDLAFQVAHNALIANRAKEINIHNAKVQKDIDAALAKKNTKAAEALEKTKITIRASQEEIDAGLEAMETYPEIKEALKVFTEYKNGLVDFLQATGRINAETARNWKENAGYVPWTRVEKEVDLLEANPISYKTGLINLSQLPKLDREGSTKEIANVFDNMIGLTNWAVKTGLKTRAASGMAEQLDDVVELKTDAALKREQKNNPGRVIYTYKNGERTAYLVGSVLDIPVFSTNIEVLGPMMKAFKAVGDFQRGAITHMPAFALSQLIQDGTYRAALLSGVEKPFQLSLRVFKNFGKALRGDLSEIAALGVTGVYDGMPDQMMERARVRYGLKERGAAKKAWDKLEKFSLAADLAVRSAIYEQTMQETNGDQRLALYRAKEYINFKRAGASPTIRTLRHVVPFMNAYIQGTDVLLRTMRGKGVSLQEKRKAQQLFLATGLKLAALNAMYTMLVSGDDEYEGLEEYERDKNYIIPGTGVKIPVAPEVGFLFKVIPERLLRYIVSQGTERPQDAETFYTGFRDAFVTAYGGVNITPQLIKPALEVMVNYSFFTSNPIVGRGMSEEAQFQFNSGTSELAKLFGNIGISPLKADYLIRGYTGMAGAIVLDMVDAVADPDRATKPIFKTPQISTFMYDPTGRGYKSDFYRFRESVDKVVDTVNMFKREGRDEELEEYLTEDRLKLYAMKGVTAKVLGTLSNLRKQRNIIANDKELSGAEKRELVDELLAEEKEILLEYNIPQLRKEMEE